MQFNDTTHTNPALIQDCEHWTNLGDGTISGDSTLLKQFTAALNDGFDELLPIIYSSDAKWQWDDSNHTDNPIATTDLVSGQADYSFLSDENGNSVLEIMAVFVKNRDGDYVKVKGVDSESDGRTDEIFAQNSGNSGVPVRYDKFATTVWLDPVPDYSASAGIRAVFSRTPSYFVSSDTTKTPGIPQPFHRLLSMIASYDWLCVHKAENTTLLSHLNNKIVLRKQQLVEHMSKRSKDEKTVVRPRIQSSR